MPLLALQLRRKTEWQNAWCKCIHSLQPQDAIKKAADAASDKASDAADSAKFTLNKDLPISKGTIDAPDTILDQALPEAAKNLPPPPSKLLHMLGPKMFPAVTSKTALYRAPSSFHNHLRNMTKEHVQPTTAISVTFLLLPGGMSPYNDFKLCMVVIV